MTRVGDAPIGAAFLALSLAVLWHVSDFPPAPGQPYGPALFPGLIAAGLAACSALLLVTALRAKPSARDAGAVSHRASPVRGVPANQPAAAPGWAPFVITLIALVGYVVLVNRLGFLPSAVLMLGALLYAYGVKPWLAGVVALVGSLLVHTAFYKLLKVPLPWGILSSLAW